MEQHNSQYVRITQAPIGRLIISLAIPTIISMLVTAIYNMADTWFVSKLGTSASGAVGVVFSLMAIIQAVGFTVGMGSGTWISRLLGAKEHSTATTVAASGLWMSIILGIAIASIGLTHLDALMRLLGATETIVPYARAYASYILYAAPIMAASFVLNNILRAEGLARLSMIGITTGGILNCILDPLFIFGLNLGIGGAAIATALSQCIGFSILLTPFLRGKTATRINPGQIAKNPGVYLRIIKNGQGYQPVLGYNYGAKNRDRVRAAFFFTIRASCIVMTVAAVILFIFAPSFMRFFIAQDPRVVRIGTFALRAQSLAMPLIPLMVTTNTTLQATGRAWASTLLSAMRQGIFFLPLIVILPRFFGLTGVEITQSLSDLCSSICAVPFILSFLHNLDGLGSEPKSVT